MLSQGSPLVYPGDTLAKLLLDPRKRVMRLNWVSQGCYQDWRKRVPSKILVQDASNLLGFHYGIFPIGMVGICDHLLHR